MTAPEICFLTLPLGYLQHKISCMHCHESEGHGLCWNHQWYCKSSCWLLSLYNMENRLLLLIIHFMYDLFMCVPHTHTHTQMIYGRIKYKVALDLVEELMTNYFFGCFTAGPSLLYHMGALQAPASLDGEASFTYIHVHQLSIPPL